MRSNKSLFAVIALAVLCTQCCSYYKNKNKSRTLALLLSAPPQSLDQAIDIARTVTKTKSISAMIIRGDGTAEGAVSNAADGTNPVTIDTRFSIGSCTKMFIAGSVFKLIEANKFSLDDTLQKLLYETGMLGDSHKSRINPSIRVKDLLYHRTGIRDYLADATYYTAVYASPNSAWDHIKTLSYVGSPDYTYDNANRGNNAFKYSNTNYILLGMVIEQATGIKVQESISEYFLSPLGLGSTYMAGVDPYPGLKSIPGNMAIGYEKDIFGNWVKSSAYITEDATAMYSSTWTCGNMVSTAGDMARWVKQYYQLQRSKGYLAADFFKAGAVSSDYFTERTFGCGIEYVRHRSGAELWGHTGTIMGFNSLVFHIPAKDLSVAVLINDHYPERWTILHIILEYVNAMP
ncbi:MAG: beta-lactamase family protein [Spirochaetes bacterium]|nr:beta-lactamase family protein [Spirochaetota bacterium]